MTIQDVLRKHNITDRTELEKHFERNTYNKKELLSILGGFSGCNFANKSKRALINKILQHYEIAGMSKAFRDCVSEGK